MEPTRFGGTCLNPGVHPVEDVRRRSRRAIEVREVERLGVHATLDRVDWPAIRDRVFGRIDPIHDSAVDYCRRNGIDVYSEPARFVAPKVLDVAGETITADQVVVA